MDGLALAWVVMAAHGQIPLFIQKSGGGGGFMSYIAFVLGRDVGIFVAVNRVDFTHFFGLTRAANKFWSLTSRRASDEARFEPLARAAQSSESLESSFAQIKLKRSGRRLFTVPL